MSPPLAKARFSVDFFERNFNPCQGINRATAFPAQMRRTSINRSRPAFSVFGAISQGDTRSGIAHPEPAREGVSPCPPNQRAFDECCRGRRGWYCPIWPAFAGNGGVRSKQPDRYAMTGSAVASLATIAAPHLEMLLRCAFHGRG
jgi:hypothetical protein